MLIEVLKSKIHKAAITGANLHYVGSITIENEKVHVLNLNNGERLETYIIRGNRGSGEICLNGAAARKVIVGDVIIIMSFAIMDSVEAKSFKPKIIFPDTNTNKLI
jgi:aspartate 1-decarboxylase